MACLVFLFIASAAGLNPAGPTSLSERRRKPPVTEMLVSAQPSPSAATTPLRQHQGLIVLCCILAFATDSNGAMLGAFFAGHLVDRGVSTTAIGTAIGVSSGVGLLGVAPLAPRVIHRLGAPRTMLCSALVYAACRFAMAALAPLRHPKRLITLTMLALTVQACADARRHDPNPRPFPTPKSVTK